MTDPESVWIVSVIKDFVWVPLCAAIASIVAYYHKRQDGQDKKISDILNSLGITSKEDREVLSNLTNTLLELKFKIAEVERSVLTRDDVNGIFKGKLEIVTHSLSEITAMIELMSRNLEKHSEKNIRQEEQIKSLSKELDRVAGKL